MVIDVAGGLLGGYCLWRNIVWCFVELRLLWCFTFRVILFGISLCCWCVGCWLVFTVGAICCAGCHYAFVILLPWDLLSIVLMLCGLVLVVYSGFTIAWFDLFRSPVCCIGGLSSFYWYFCVV